jgi:hypothetical protein
MTLSKSDPSDLNENTPPLVVDLDGTVLRSDLLIESGFAFIRRHPLRTFALLAWLIAGKACLKTRLASIVCR